MEETEIRNDIYLTKETIKKINTGKLVKKYVRYVTP
tara:strand:- start:659 stop:766 length:108 start_codon:yes stop_codon:yes gene_type:complete